METKQHTLGDTFATYFKEVIYGGIDGIVTTFAVVAGFAGAAISNNETTQLSFAVVLLFGLANLFADAASMGLGNFLSVRSEKDLYVAKQKVERADMQAAPEAEVTETVNILKEKGFSEADAVTLAGIYRNNEDYWLDFMMNNEHEMSDPRGENEVYTGLATFLSFMVFGAIPLIPFMIFSYGDPKTTFIYSSVGTLLALIVLGLMKWKVVGSGLKSSITEVVLVGGTAAILAYYVGTFFAGL